MKAIEPLTAVDRCDRCGAQAVTAARVSEESESLLLMCGHHTNKHRVALLQSATAVWAQNGTVVFDKKAAVPV